jgi:hypothetical protein
MRAADLPDALLITLDELAALAPAADSEMLAALRGRLRAARLRVLVVGEAKRGKSTLVNALLGREVLPVGVTPLTALATAVRHGPDEHVEVRFLDGQDRFPLAALDDLVTERGNRANSRAIAGVTIWLGAPVLARALRLWTRQELARCMCTTRPKSTAPCHDGCRRLRADRGSAGLGERA